MRFRDYLLGEQVPPQQEALAVDLNKTWVQPVLAFADEVTETSISRHSPDRPLWDPNHRTFCTHLSVDTRAHGMDLAAGSEIYYTKEGRLTSIFSTEDIQAFGTTYPSGSILHFYMEGTLDWVSLGSETPIQLASQPTLSIRAMGTVSFYRNGQVKETTLDQRVRWAGLSLPPNSVVHFSTEGQLVWIHLAQPMVVTHRQQELLAQANSCVEFHHNGQVRSVHLAESATIQQHYFPRDVTVHFEQSGTLALAQLHSLKKHKKVTESIRFDRDGEITEITSY